VVGTVISTFSCLLGKVDKSMQVTPITLTLFKKIRGGKTIVPFKERHTQISFHPN